MNLIVAEKAGFCCGVERAFELGAEFLKGNGKKKRVVTMHPIVHNTSVMTKLYEMGLEQITSFEEAGLKPGDIYVVNAHGDPAAIEKAKKLGLQILDTTCGNVKKAQQAAKDFRSKGYFVLVYGKPGHAEMKGITYFTLPEMTYILESLEKSKSFAALYSNNNDVGLISQTTMMLDEFKQIGEYLKQALKVKVTVADTVCSSTKERQEEAEAIAKQVKIMIVVGGYDSSNTKSLADICRKTTTTYHIESPAQLKPEWFSDKCDVGVTAGASTPKRDIEGVIEKIRVYSS
jgi:4-hydroxy-3-methylbut-2-enyl diphosphate reductase